MSRKVGFIGMGIMGQAMAKNLLAGGCEVMVYNRTREKTGPLEEAGARTAATPLAAAEWAEVIILMLTGPEAIDNVLLGEGGILKGTQSDKMIINMSTVSPEYTLKLAELLKTHGMRFIDSPVSGSKKPAQDATLVILASGEEKQVSEFEPLLLKMGKKVVYCGEAGKGSCMKMVVNLLLGIMMEGLCEAINLGEKCGLSMDSMLDTLLGGPLGCGLFNLKTDMIKNDDYPPQFPFKHMTKDIRFVLATADDKGAAVPAGHAVFQLYRQGVGHRLGDMDFAAIKKVLSELNDQ